MFTVAADRQEVPGSAPTAESGWPPCGWMAGQPISEGVPQSVLPSTAGVPLPDGRSGEECQAMSETAPAEHSDHHAAVLAY